MATYAIGDIQGCFFTLQNLLKKIPWDPDRDRLWLVGDLVNRGPRSLEVLRWAKAQANRLIAVLGNHDLHLIARALGVGRPKKNDTLQAILDAPDREDLIQWLRERPLLHLQGKVALVHAGLDPSWSISEAHTLAQDLEGILRGPQAPSLLQAIYNNAPRGWDPNLPAQVRLPLALKIMTSIRICGPGGVLPFQFSGPPAMAPLGYLPWFRVPARKSEGITLVCGHWAALGLKIEPGLMALDSGCVYGRELTAVRLEDQAMFQVPYADGDGVPDNPRV